MAKEPCDECWKRKVEGILNIPKTKIEALERHIDNLKAVKQSLKIMSPNGYTEQLDNIYFVSESWVTQLKNLLSIKMTEEEPCKICGHRWEGHTTADGGQTTSCEEEGCDCTGEWN